MGSARIQLVGPVMAFLFFSAGMNAEAWLGRFSGKEAGQGAEGVNSEEVANADQGEKLREFSEEEGRDFVVALALRQQASETVEVLQRLLNRKKSEGQSLKQKLADTYGYHMHASHRLAGSTQTLYRRASSDNGHEDEAIHHFLNSEEVNEFQQLLRSRNRCFEEVRSLERLIEEQVEQMIRVNAFLQENYGIDPEKNYRYDNETRSLYVYPESQELGKDTIFMKEDE